MAATNCDEKCIFTVKIPEIDSITFDGIYVKITSEEPSFQAEFSKIEKFTSRGVLLQNGTVHAYLKFGSVIDRDGDGVDGGNGSLFHLHEDEELIKYFESAGASNDRAVVSGSETINMHFEYLRLAFHTILSTVAMKSPEDLRQCVNEYWEKITFIYKNLFRAGLNFFKAAADRERTERRQGASDVIKAQVKYVKQAQGKHIENAKIERGAIKILSQSAGVGAESMRRFASNSRPFLKYTVGKLGLLPTEPLCVNLSPSGKAVCDRILAKIQAKNSAGLEGSEKKVYEALEESHGVRYIDIINELYKQGETLLTCVDGNHRIQIMHEKTEEVHIALYWGLTKPESKAVSSLKGSSMFQAQQADVHTQLVWFLHTIIPRAFGKMKINPEKGELADRVTEILETEGFQDAHTPWFYFAYNNPGVLVKVLEFGCEMKKANFPQLNFVKFFTHFVKFDMEKDSNIIKRMYDVLLLAHGRNARTTSNPFSIQKCRQVKSWVSCGSDNDNLMDFVMERLIDSSLLNRALPKTVENKTGPGSSVTKWDYIFGKVDQGNAFKSVMLNFKNSDQTLLNEFAHVCTIKLIHHFILYD